MRGFGRFAADGDNLVLFDQHKKKNTFDTIIPDLAESWTRSEDGNGADLQAPPGGQLA